MNFERFGGLLMAVSLAAFLAACGGSDSGGGSTSTDTGGGDTGTTEPADCVSDGGTVVLSGTVLFEDVPAVTGNQGVKLDYDAVETKPVRDAEMYVECADGSETYAESVTDANGQFSVEVPDGVDVSVVVRAMTLSTGGPTWDVKVVDNTNSKAVWTLVSDRIATGSSNLDVEVVAESGWDGTSYTGERVAGALSILDTVYNAMELVMTANPNATFPPITLNWSPENTASDGSGTYPYPNGRIGTSFFTSREQQDGSILREIYIVGKANSDTDEYDDTVVAHEWGHYYEDAFARSDSVGGPHSGGDALDIRVAFGEGWGNAVSGMITGDDTYRDTRGAGQEGGFFVGLEAASTTDKGWWNETSVQQVLYDLYDSRDDQNDVVSLGFGPLHDVLTNDQRLTPAFTSIFSLVAYLQDGGHVSQADMDSLLSYHDIGPVSDIWGSNRTKTAPDGFDDTYSVPVYVDLNPAVNSGTITDICVNKTAGEYNKLGNRRFGTFTPNTTATYRFELDGRTVANAVEGSDPDLYLYANAVPATSGTDLFDSAGGDWSSPDATEDDNPDKATYGDSYEVAEAELTAGTTYVMDLHEWMNHDALFDPAEGDTTGGSVCLDLKVSIP